MKRLEPSTFCMASGHLKASAQPGVAKLLDAFRARRESGDSTVLDFVAADLAHLSPDVST